MIPSKQLAKVSRVCKCWYSVCCSPEMWEDRKDLSQIFGSRLNQVTTATEAIAIIKQKRFKHVKHLALPTIKMGSTTIAKMADAMPFLKSLDLTNTKGLNHKHYADMVARMPGLEELVLGQSFSSGNLRALAGLKTLKRLNMNGMLGIIQGVSSIALMPSLEQVQLAAGFWSNYDDNTNHIDRQLATWPKDSLPNLKRLNLSQQWRLSDEGLLHVAAACPVLEQLELRGLSNITGEGLRALANYPLKTTLKHLVLNGCGSQARVQRGSGSGRAFYQRGPCNISQEDLDFIEDNFPQLQNRPVL